MRAILKWVFISLLILALGLTAAVWYYGRNWKPLIESKLKEVVFKETGGLYSLNYSDLDLNIGLGNITFNNVELIPDSAVYRQQILTKEAPNNRYHIKLKALKVKRFSLSDVLSRKQLNIKSVVFQEPEVHLISEYHAYNDTVSQKQPKTLYENLKDVFKSVNVKDIQIDKVKFKYSKLEEGNFSEINLDEVSINVHDVLVDETSMTDSTRLFYTKRVNVHIPNFEYDLPDDYYRAKFENLIINTEEQNVLMTNVSYAPKMSKASFYKAKRENVTMAALAFDTLRLENLDFHRLIDNQQLVARKVQVKNGSVDLSADKRYPKKVVSKIGHAPHQQLMQAKKLLRLDTVVIEDVDLAYHEFSAKFNKEGTISFDRIKGALTNVTNDASVLNKDKFMRADLVAQVMGRGRLHIKFGFDMKSKNGYHTYNGTLGTMNATAFNRILQPLLNVEIASGNIRKISFNMEGTDYRNWGDFRFDYNNLKISLFNTEKKSKSKVVSFLVNQILINDSNPDANEIYHVGKVNYKRLAEYSFFKTLWQSLLEGIKQTAGISPEREAKLMGTAERVKTIRSEAQGVGQKTSTFFKRLFEKKDEKKSN